MPELPEAENIGRALNEKLTGRTITRVEVFSPRMRTPLTPLLTAGMEGHAFTGVRRRGRYLVAELDDFRGLLMHFGMSGVVRIEGAEVPKRKHEHVFLHLDDGKIFRFECTRRFSILELHTLPERGGWPECLKRLGVEPLSSDFTGEVLFKRSRKKSCPIKNFIMDNSVVVGIGNIYATETLFACKIDPRRKAETLTRPQCKKIVEEAKRILRAAIEAGGSTIADYRRVDGSPGEYAKQIRIYGKAGETCPCCGAVIKSVCLGGRTSVYCSKCQK